MVPFSVVYFLICVICSSNCKSHFDHPAIYQITDPIDHAEGPSWDGRRNILFYVDVHSGRVFSYNYNIAVVHFITLKGDVTPVIPAKKNNLLIVGLNRSVVAVKWDGTGPLGGQKILTTVSQQYPKSQINEGKADKKGRLWFGTKGETSDPSTGDVVPDQGILYKITRDNLVNPTVEIKPVNISNGLAWNAANDKFYFIDTSSPQISEYDYDNKKGSISNRRVVFDLRDYPELTGSPDGMTIDIEDNLWIALYGGGSVIQVNPRDGSLLQRIALPARYVTSVMWGGPDLDVLFVTTSRLLLNEEETRAYPAAGSVFAVTNLKTRGMPVFNSDVVDSL